MTSVVVRSWPVEQTLDDVPVRLSVPNPSRSVSDRLGRSANSRLRASVR